MKQHIILVGWHFIKYSKWFFSISLYLTLYDPGGGFKSPPPPIFCSHAFNFGAALLCVGDFSQKIV